MSGDRSDRYKYSAPPAASQSPLGLDDAGVDVAGKLEDVLVKKHEQYKYSPPESETTLRSDEAANGSSIGRKLEDLHVKKYGAKNEQGIVVPKSDDSETVREYKEVGEEVSLRIPEQKSVDTARWELIQHCYSTSSDGVVSRSELIRPDVVALGFGHFEQGFEPHRILCMFETGEKHHVSLVFFHVEGMATLFGVGLPFSKVLLKEDSVEIREVEESVWRDCWKEQTGRQSYPLLFCFTDRNGNRRFDQAAASTSQVSKHVKSEDEAAELCGVGVEGLNEFTDSTSELERVSQILDGQRPAWLSLMYKLLLQQEGASDWHTTMTAYRENIPAPEENHGHSGQDAQVSTSYESLGVPHTYLSITDSFLSLLKGFTGLGSASDEKSSSQTDYQQLRLVVVVYLDPSGYKFYSPLEKTDMPFVRDSGKVKITVSEDELELSDYEMVPTVVISFFYNPTVKGRSSKRMLTALGSRFHMDGSVSDGKVFGWYHDELRLSFRCCEANVVMREKRQIEEEILSRHEVRCFGKERGFEDSTHTLKGRGKEFELAGGHQYFAQLRFKGSSNSELTKGNTLRDQFSGQVVALCLKDANFGVRNVEAGSQELAYQASMFPPESYYSKWDNADRELAAASGMMSSVELKIEGKWIVKEQDDALSQRPGLCAYDFLCQRKLAQHRLATVQPVKTRKFWKHQEEGKLNLVENLLQQKLSKFFLVNHNFSHMTYQRLQRPEAYEWDITNQITSPLEEIVR